MDLKMVGGAAKASPAFLFAAANCSNFLTSMANLSESIRSRFTGKKIVIIGDLVADQFLKGTISRVSREAPVFILRHDETETLPGAAANAATNVASLGALPVLIGAVGDDPNGRELLAALELRGVDCTHVHISPDIRTTTKVRVLAGQHYAPRQQVIRIDYENSAAAGENVASELEASIGHACTDADAIIVSDYGYGAATPELAALAISLAEKRAIPVIVDSRYRLKQFPGAAERDAEPGRGRADPRRTIYDGRLRTAPVGARVRRPLLVTCGNEGIILAEKGNSPVRMAAIGSTNRSTLPAPVTRSSRPIPLRLPPE